MKNLKLRLSLLKVWFIKNALMFAEIAIVTLLILIFTGVLPESTPILGTIIKEIREACGDSSKWIRVLSSITAAITALGMFAKKAKSIALSDIKSDDLKRKLINANMYFNEQGKLVKKETPTEASSKNKLAVAGAVTDAIKNNDRTDAEVIADAAIQTVGFFGRVRDMFQEFHNIATIELDEDAEKAQEQYEQAIVDNGMEEAAAISEKMSERSNESIDETVENAIDKVEDIVSDKVDETASDEETAEKKKSVVSKVFAPIKAIGVGIARIFKKKNKEESTDEESSKDKEIEESETKDEASEPAVEKAAEKAKEAATAEETVTEEKSSETATTATSTEKTSVSKNVNADRSKEAFLNRLRNGHK